MKKTIVSIIVIVALITMSLVLNSFVADSNGNQDSNNAFVSVRIYEYYMMTSSIIVVYEDGTTDTFLLKKNNRKSNPANLATINSKLSEIKAKGYELVTSNYGISDGGSVSTYIFQKEK